MGKLNVLLAVREAGNGEKRTRGRRAAGVDFNLLCNGPRPLSDSLCPRRGAVRGRQHREDPHSFGLGSVGFGCGTAAKAQRSASRVLPRMEAAWPDRPTARQTDMSGDKEEAKRCRRAAADMLHPHSRNRSTERESGEHACTSGPLPVSSLSLPPSLSLLENSFESTAAPRSPAFLTSPNSFKVNFGICACDSGGGA